MQISHEIVKTSDVSRSLLRSMVAVFESSFGNADLFQDTFDWKYRDNPMGESLHLLSYCNTSLIACRSFWRLFTTTDELQCVDTAVSKDFQSLGVFKSGTQYLLSKTDNGFYNFPNERSHRQYLKSGWECRGIFKPEVARLTTALQYAPELDWVTTELEWRFSQHPKFKYRVYARAGVNYIFRMKSNIPVLIGRTNFDVNLPPIRPLLCVSYDRIPGIRLSFGGHTNAISIKSNQQRLHPYMMDMM